MHAFLLVLSLAFAGDSWGAPAGTQAAELHALPAEWSLATLPGAHSGISLAALKRHALTPPARYRVVVIPGSGCTGWVPLAARYFAGLLQAELLLLHKPGVDISAGLAAQCSAAFVQNDNLPAWPDHAQAALQAHFSPTPTTSQQAPYCPYFWWASPRALNYCLTWR